MDPAMGPATDPAMDPAIVPPRSRVDSALPRRRMAMRGKNVEVDDPGESAGGCRDAKADRSETSMAARARPEGESPCNECVVSREYGECE